MSSSDNEGVVANRVTLRTEYLRFGLVNVFEGLSL
jgi:hypothetical protein